LYHNHVPDINSRYSFELPPQQYNTTMSSSNQPNNVADRVKKTAREELINAKDLARSGVVSGTYLYPIKASDYPSME
jgi:hypothetical protein